jgi:hypothetical protein
MVPWSKLLALLSLNMFLGIDNTSPLIWSFELNIKQRPHYATRRIEKALAIV